MISTAIMAAKIRAANPIIAVDLQDARLDLAKKLGATHIINWSAPDIVQQIQQLCLPNGSNYGLECTGVPQVIEKMLEAMGTRGRCAVIG